MGSKAVTTDDYYGVYKGMTETALKEKFGQPYATRTIDSHTKVYEYMERVVSNEHIYQTRHYLFIIKDGVVADKKMQFEANDLFDTRDAYDLQTSENYKINPKNIQ
jgi:hypothetical protein